MIEVYVLLTLSGLGYIISKSSGHPGNPEHPRTSQRGKPHRKKHYATAAKTIPNDIYHSTQYKDVHDTVQVHADKLYKKSRTPQTSKVISSDYKDIVTNTSKQTYESKLSGAHIPMDDFSHNNMTPFFGGSMKQNTDLENNVNNVILENYTGVGEIYDIEKQENLCFADVRNNVDTATSKTMNSYEKEYERMSMSQIKSNELPFEKVYVGPGLNSGYGNTPTQTGFQPDTREYALPKTVDELRTKTNPKSTFQGRTLEGQRGLKRGMQAPVNKNRVDTFAEMTPDRYLKTTGAFLKDKHRPCHIVKDTNRKRSVAYSGNVYKNIGNEQSSKLQPTKKKILNRFGVRNVDLEKHGKGNAFDYGKNNILVYNNERDITSTRTYEGNLTTYVKSLIAPVQDIFKTTTKEYTLGNAREFGQMQTTFPDKQTIYDPNDIARTTIKETNIHDTRTGDIVGEKKPVVYDPDDIARTTLKETLPSYENVINMKGGTKKQTVYDPTDVTRTTIRETTENNDHHGQINTLEGGGGYETNTMDAPNTLRQFTSDTEYMGTGPHKENRSGYLNKEMAVDPTQKEFISNHEHFGGAHSTDKKQMSYTDIYNATINEVKEALLEKREPTDTRVKLVSGGETMNVQSNKFDCEREASRDTNNIERINNEPVTTEFFNLTKHKVDLEPDNGSDGRLDPDILTAFHENPYTKPLNTAV